MPEKSIVIKSGSDEEIIALCKGEIDNRRDVSLKESSTPQIEHGLYDPNIFGAIYGCGCERNYRRPGKCPRCGRLVVDSETGADRFGYYTLNMPIIHLHKIQSFHDDVKSVFPKLMSYYGRSNQETGLENIWGTKITPEPVSDTEDKLFDYVKDTNGQVYRLKYEDYSKEDSIDNYKYYGPRGLLSILKNYRTLTGQLISKKLEDKLNSVIPISPAVTRRYTKINDKITFPQQTIMYAMIIDFNESINVKFSTDESLTLADLLTLSFALNHMVNLAMRTYPLVKTSKESLVRYAMGGRVAKSQRATIVGDPTLDIDTVMIPEAAAYEALKEDLLKEYSVRYPKRLELEDYMNAKDDMIKLLYEIAENSVVIINRQPTLFRFGTLAQHVRLYKGNVMKMSDLTCVPMNADKLLMSA